MAHNWNTGGQEILGLFLSVIGAPDRDKFLAIIKEAVTSVADMDITEAHALLNEVYQAYPYFTSTGVGAFEPVPPFPVDAFSMH
jgi:hypothetical protein